MTRAFYRYMEEILHPAVSYPSTQRDTTLFGVSYDLAVFIGTHSEMQHFIGEFMRTTYSHIMPTSVEHTQMLHQWLLDIMHPVDPDNFTVHQLLESRYPSHCLVIYANHVVQEYDKASAYDVAYIEAKADGPSVLKRVAQRSEHVYVTSERELLAWNPPVCVQQPSSSYYST